MAAVNNQDDSQLAVIIDDKDALIVRLTDIDQKIIEMVRDLNEADRDSLAGENEELGRCIEADLGKIIEQENACQEKLNSEKSEVVEKIMGLRKGKQLLKGYERSQRIKPKISKNV